MPFEILNPLDATLKSVTIRNEKHGDDDVTGITMGLKATVPNTFLDLIDPTIRQSLYMAVPDQEQLDGIEPATPLLRSRSFETLHLKHCFEGWTLEIDHGIDASDPIKLGGTKVDRFVLSPKEGGSVDMAFRVGSNDIDATEIGLIGAKLAQEISVLLRAPVAPAPAIDGSTAAFDADHPGEPDAGDLFGAAHGGQHAGDFGADRGDDEGSPRTSDDAGGEGSDSEGGETDAGQDDAAAFEAGLSKEIAAKGLKPKRTGAAANDGKKRRAA